MSTSNLLRVGAAVGAVLASVSTSRAAHALACNDPSLQNPIYLVGGSAPLPVFQKVATALANLSTPITLVYQSSGGSCAGVNTMITPPASGLTGNASYWTSGGTLESCTFTTPGTTADLGVADSYATLCPGVTALPAGVGDFLGPVQPFDFIVPAASQASSISAQAGYFVFGFGAGSSAPSYPVSNWTVPADIITRNNQSGTAIITAAILGVPLGDVASTTIFTDGRNSLGVLSDVAGSANADATLGIIASDVVETSSTANLVKVLAYQHYGQSCGWLPNSTSTTYDKFNVRYGLYAYWSNIHFIANVNSSNVPTDANAQKVIGWFQDTVTPPTGVDVDQLTVQAGGVLQCAMEVQRTVDAGPLLPYAPAEPCDCFFEANVPGGSTTCTACTSNATCPANAPNCRKGYCEVN